MIFDEDNNLKLVDFGTAEVKSNNENDNLFQQY